MAGTAPATVIAVIQAVYAEAMTAIIRLRNVPQTLPTQTQLIQHRLEPIRLLHQAVLTAAAVVVAVEPVAAAQDQAVATRNG